MAQNASNQRSKRFMTLAIPEHSNISPSVETVSCKEESSCGDALFNGDAPARKSLFGDLCCPKRIECLCISEKNPSKISAFRTNLKREQPMLQDPTETFEKMNVVMHQTLKYVKEVESIDFCSSHIIDFNGERMDDPRRVFLSVCASVLANFSFSSPLDIEKLISFLSDLYDRCPTENAYHNPLHAADSLQMLFLILREKPATVMFTDDEVLVTILATLCISFVHPGVTNAFLARIDHPLTLVYGDMSTQQSASLTVFLYLLNREENRFVDLSAASGSQPFSQFLRELFVETVLGTAPRARVTLLRDLQEIASAKEVLHKDIPFLMKAVVILADNALALRPRQQFITLATSMLGEWLRESCEEERRGMEFMVPDLRTRAQENGLGLVSEYCKLWLRPLAITAHALVPQDLYDNVERNSEVPSFSEVVEFVVPDVSPDERWSDGSIPVVEILRKITMHATSLDRKASKQAILNAISSRQAPSSLSSQVSSPQNSMGDVRVAIAENSAIQNHIRSEHYFSFLRLYDTYEKEDRPASEFAAQLVFLALQLNPMYIGRYAQENIDISSKDQCGIIARMVLESEEAPSTAEVIASPSRDGEKTDGFILQLMEMFADRAAERNSTTPCGPLGAGSNRQFLYCHNPVYGNGPRPRKS